MIDVFNGEDKEPNNGLVGYYFSVGLICIPIVVLIASTLEQYNVVRASVNVKTHLAFIILAVSPCTGGNLFQLCIKIDV